MHHSECLGIGASLRWRNSHLCSKEPTNPRPLASFLANSKKFAAKIPSFEALEIFLRVRGHFYTARICKINHASISPQKSSCFSSLAIVGFKIRSFWNCSEGERIYPTWSTVNSQSSFQYKRFWLPFSKINGLVLFPVFYVDHGRSLLHWQRWARSCNQSVILREAIIIPLPDCNIKS